MVTLNLAAIGLSAVACTAIGFAYYSPFVLGKPWMKEMGLDKKKMAKMKKEKNMAAIYGLTFIAAIVTAIVMSGFVEFFRATKWAGTMGAVPEGALVGFLAWLGFAATTGFTDALFGDKGIKLFFLNTGHQALCFIATGIIVTVIA
ncbi:MAG: DUF1761 domain-containing protein [Nanoarchaeota archaeon]